MSAAITEWTTVTPRKTWAAAPITSSGLRRVNAEHPDFSPPQAPVKKKEEEFPALPGVKRPAAASAAAGAGLNFKEMARESAARFERDEAFRLAEQARMAREVTQAEIDRRRVLSRIPTRSHDDGPSDYDPPEEEEEGYYEDSGYEESGYEEETDEARMSPTYMEYRQERVREELQVIGRIAQRWADEEGEDAPPSYSYYAANGMRRGHNEFW